MNLSFGLDLADIVECAGESCEIGEPIALGVPSDGSETKRPADSGSGTIQANAFKPSGRGGGTEPGSNRKKRTEAMARATAAEPARVPVAPAKPAKETKESKLARRDRVVMEHLPLVKAIAVRVHESLPVHVELDDLVHAGILGLFDAATKYNPDKKVIFSSYAKHRIKGAILDSLRQLDWASRDLRRRHKQVEQVTRDLCATLQRNPTEDEVAERLGVDVARWRQMALDLRNVGLVSASSRAPENEDLPAPDFPSKPETQPDSMCAREELREKLDLALGALPERYKKVVLLYYTNEMTMKEIGGLLGINESRVSQIHKSALEKMATALQSNGITSASAF
jgi:RNA polymerase sigma factor for flagellar operon FliA